MTSLATEVEFSRDFVSEYNPHSALHSFYILTSTQGDTEWQLLDSNSSDSDLDIHSDVAKHDLLTAPLMTREAYMVRASDGYPAQYGVLGKILSI